ncbi:MAG: DNA topoisomerase [Treponema sp.]|nr:DNA topoisomerase [Treponema sp.]
MLILTEKPSVAKDFAKALGCSFSSKEKCWTDTDKSILITNCVGHLFELEEPSFYDPKFKSWKYLPVIPERFEYRINPALKAAASTVGKLLKANKSKEILIATDADREGEIIARECLMAYGISDFSKIKRFWVSQALTPSVIKNGIRSASPLSDYNNLSDQGFARQHSDWLVGINGTRFITNKAGEVLPVGRVQTAVLNAICERCDSINNFKSEEYFEIEGVFEDVPNGIFIKGLYSEDGKTRFRVLPEWTSDINKLKNIPCELISLKTTEKEELPPMLYNLNDLQKDAFRLYEFSAEKTLSVVQKLYEEYKCVSYPRTPSKVMGSDNVQMVKDLYSRFASEIELYNSLQNEYEIKPSDKRHFNDEKLDSHHALIPLEILPSSATDDDSKIYFLILERFLLSFGLPCKYLQTVAIVKADGKDFEIKGNQIIEAGWKKHRRIQKPSPSSDDDENIQFFSSVDWENLTLSYAKWHTKYTKAPKHFNEASILAFMENPKNEDDSKKLAGLGTSATRHTFIPKLLKSKYIDLYGKNIIITEKGRHLLNLLKTSSMKNLCEISETTRWEEHLAQNPINFETDIKRYIAAAIANEERRGQ